MKYQEVFEFQSEDSAMSDVYHCKDGMAAQDKFLELRDSLAHAVEGSDCNIIDEPGHYSVIDRKAGIYGYVRLLND